MKKLLALMLALMMSMTFAACNKEDEDTSDKKEKTKTEQSAEKKDSEDVVKNDSVDESAEVEAVVKNFLDAFCAFDVNTAATFTNDPDAIRELMPIDASNMESALLSEIPAEFSQYKTEFSDFAQNMLRKATAACSYRIQGIEKQGDDYIVTVSLTVPTDWDDLALDDIFTDTAVQEILMSLLNSGKLNENMSEDQMMKVLLPELFDYALDNMTLDTETKDDGKIVVSNFGGKWLIDFEKTENI